MPLDKHAFYSVKADLNREDLRNGTALMHRPLPLAHRGHQIVGHLVVFASHQRGDLRLVAVADSRTLPANL